MSHSLKRANRLQVAMLATATLFTSSAFNSTTATSFESSEVDQGKFIAIAAPVAERDRQLLILEQVSSKRACWSESGTSPITVEPLLVQFDFTGICRRSTDSNGYSIRMQSNDLGWRYMLRLVKRNDELVLVGTSTTERNVPPIEIGRTYGMSSGFEKIILNPGWRFTKRTFNGQTLGHVYLTSDVWQQAAQPNQ